MIGDYNYNLDGKVLNSHLPTLDTSELFEGDHWDFTPKTKVKKSIWKSLYDYLLVFGIAFFSILAILFLLLSL